MVRELCGQLPGAPAFVSQLTLSGPAAGGSVTFYTDGSVLTIWDKRDRKGNRAVGGFYHLVVNLTLVNGTFQRMEKDFFLGEQVLAPVGQLTAAPNIAGAGDTIHLTATLGGQPVDPRSRAKIYTIGGEWVRSLPFAGGQATWDLTDNRNEAVASGLYMIVLEGVEAGTGAATVKMIKVVVLR